MSLVKLTSQKSFKTFNIFVSASVLLLLFLSDHTPENLYTSVRGRCLFPFHAATLVLVFFISHRTQHITPLFANALPAVLAGKKKKKTTVEVWLRFSYAGSFLGCSAFCNI